MTRAQPERLIPAGKLPKPLETPIHRAVLAHLRLTFPRAVIHHSPNAMNVSGSPVSKAIAQKRAVLDGMVKGFPDLMVLWRDAAGATHFYAFEVKREGEKPKPEQTAVGALIKANGGRWAVVRSVDDVAEAIREWRGAIE